MIPGLIHQVYSSRELPPAVQQSVRTIRELNPGWEHRLYDNAEMEDFIRVEYGRDMLGTYHRINGNYGAARADFFRYLLMYRRGGVYLDIKSSFERPLDEVLRKDDEYLLSRWPRGGHQYEGWGKHRKLRRIGGREFQQWHIIAAPGHPFLQAVIERVVRNIGRYHPLWHNTGKDGVVRLTGPVAYTLAIAPLMHRYPHRCVENHKDLGLIYSVYERDGRHGHKSIFKIHYTKLDEPVIELTGNARQLWRVSAPFKKHMFDRPIGGLRRLMRKRSRSAARPRTP